VAAQQEVREFLCVLREPLEVSESRLPPLGAPRAQGRRDHRLEEAALPVGRGAEGAQVPRPDAEARERLACRGDVGLALRVEALPALAARPEHPELRELAGAIGRAPGAVAELLEIELLPPRVDDAAAPPALLACARLELLPDHP